MRAVSSKQKSERYTDPSSIPVLGETFRVEMVDAILDDDEAVGECLPDISLIRLVRSQGSRRKWKTAFHEGLHGALDVTGISAYLSTELEESIVRTAETYTMQFLRQLGRELLDAVIEDQE
jgi:hypothetical protein